MGNNIKFSKTFRITNREIGQRQPVFIIAEAGVAHFGSIEKAKALVDLAVSAGVDAVKFQVFKTGELFCREAKEWLARMQSKELPFDAFREIKEYCDKKGIIFFATAHDETSLEFLDTLNVPAYKIGSGEVDNWPFLKKVALKKKPVILSTGMYTLDKINHALNIFAEVGNLDIALLHCVTLYPTPPSEVNLRMIETLKESFHVIVGYSDHTEGFHFPLAAVAFGAQIIEKHITLDVNISNAQDWKVSCRAEDLTLMVRQIREIEAGRGSGIKVLSEAERLNLRWARKSLVAMRDISKGEVITSSAIGAKRPGVGISPAYIDKIIGRKAKVDIQKDTMIRWEYLL